LFQVERMVAQAPGWTLGVSRLQPVPVWGVESVPPTLLAPAS
jgi:hypothetical protein